MGRRDRRNRGGGGDNHKIYHGCEEVWAHARDGYAGGAHIVRHLQTSGPGAVCAGAQVEADGII